MSLRLPRGVEWLLSAGLPADQRDPITGDLHEEYAGNVERRGVWRATLGVWWEAARIVITFRWEDAARGRPLPPIADESPRRTTVLDALTQDVRFGLRLLRRHPGFTVVAVLMLALGIGATTAIYSLADATILRPLPVRDIERLYAMKWSASYPSYRDYTSRTDVFDGVIAFADRDALSVQHAGQPELAAGTYVSGNYFGLLGVGAQAGRVLVPSDDGDGAALVAVVSDRFWRTRLGADASVIGSALRVNGQPVTIVGVAARGFRGTTLQSAPGLWMPLSSLRRVATEPFFVRNKPFTSRGMVWLRIVARLKPGATPPQASAALMATYNANHPASQNGGKDRADVGDLEPLAAHAAGFSTAGDLRRFLVLLGGVVAFALAIACANLANILLARSAARRREMAVRLALGVSRARLTQQMITESLLLSSAGGAAGLLVAHWMLALLGRFKLPGRIPIDALHLDLNGATLAITIAVSAITGVLFGLAPSAQSFAADIVTALKDDARSTRRHRLRSALVAAQVALSLTLLAGGALFVRGLGRALATDVGFESGHAALTAVNVSLERYDAQRASAFYDEALARLGHLPSVKAAAWAVVIPMRGSMTTSLEVDGYRSASGEQEYADTNHISGRYFQALGIPLLEGRTFDDSDHEGTAPVAIVSRSLAARYWKGRSAVGGRLRFESDLPWVDVVGVVADVRSQGLDEPPASTMYLAFSQQGRSAMLGSATLVARGDRDAGDLMGVMVRELRAIDRAVPITTAMTLDDHVHAQVLPQQMGVTLFGFFGALALLIASVGIYGVAACTVAERTRELGIRLALGARRRQIVGLVQRQTLYPVTAGVAVGLVLSVWAARVAGSVLFGLRANDPAAFVLVAGVLATAAAVAAWIPARRAARLDPTIALRQD